MFKVFEEYLQSKASFTAEQLNMINSVSVIKKIRKNQYLLQEGDVWRYNAFVCEGCLRTYSIDEKGIEHVLNFAIENWWIGDRESLLNGTPSRFNIDAIEDSVVLLITKENFDMLTSKLPEFNNLVNLILQRSFVASQNRINSNISHTAEEKYKAFIEKFGAISLRLPQHMIASYLGITPETLSRVRKQLKK